METLPNPREEPAFRKGGGLFCYIYTLVTRFLPARAFQAFAFIFIFIREDGGSAATCDGSHALPMRSPLGDGEHCSKFRSDENPGRNELRRQATKGRAASNRPTILSPPGPLQIFLNLYNSRNFFLPFSSSFILHRFPFLRTTSPAVHLAERRLVWLFCQPPHVPPVCSERQPVLTARIQRWFRTEDF
jgi:hypothetical protein